MASQWRPAAAPSNVCVPDDVSGARASGYSGGVGGSAVNGANGWLNQMEAAAGVRERTWGPSTGQVPVYAAPRPGEEAVELPLPPALAAQLAARGAPVQGVPVPALVTDFARLQQLGPPMGSTAGPQARALPATPSGMAAAWQATRAGPAPQQLRAAVEASALEHAWKSSASAGPVYGPAPAMQPLAWNSPYRSAYMPRYSAFYGPGNFQTAMRPDNTMPATMPAQATTTNQQSTSTEQRVTTEVPGQQMSAHGQALDEAMHPTVVEDPVSSDAHRSGLSFEELLRRAQVDIDDTFDDDYLHTYGREIRETAYRFQYEPEENRYLARGTRETQTRDDRAAALAALAEGERLYAEGQLAEAIMAFEAAVKLDRELSRAWYFLGVSHAESDQDPQAIASLKRALECDRDDAHGDDMIADALLCLGVSYTNELNPNQALRYLQRWLDLHPLAGPSLTRVEATASSLPSTPAAASESRPSQVEELFAQQRALLERVQTLLAQSKEAQGDADLYSVLGVVHSLMRDYDAAVLAFRRSVELRPDDYRLWNRLGATLANHFRSMEALRAYRSAIDRRPNFVRAWVNVGTSYANQGSYAQALRYYVQALQRNPRAVHVWSYLRTAAIAMNRLDILAMAEEMREDQLATIAAAIERN
jgi:tetratricopeptide (TPR) repeat protein